MRIRLDDLAKWQATAKLFGFHVKRIGHCDHVALNDKRAIVGKYTMVYNYYTQRTLERGYLHVTNPNQSN
jgi:hypothetical protein